MAGSMRQRGESWLLTAYAGWDAKAKKRRYITKTFRGTKREAAKALADLVSEVNRQQRVADATSDGKDQSVLRILNQWLDSRRAVFSPSTVNRYEVAIKHVRGTELEDLPVAKLRPHHIEDLYGVLVAKGQSGSSIRKLHWALRQSLAWAHRRGYTVIVATDGIELPPLGERKVVPPSSREVRRLLDHALSSDVDWGTAIAFVAWTGCRRGEVLGLRWSDLDLARKTVLIARSVVAIPGGVQVKSTKTGELRRLALGSKTVAMLKEHRRRCEERAQACGTALAPAGYAFSPDVRGSVPYNPHTMTRVFISMCKGAGVPHTRLHDLRHHSATALLKTGASVGEVMDRHGWKTVDMVNRYRHLLDPRDVRAAEAIENLDDGDAEEDPPESAVG